MSIITNEMKRRVLASKQVRRAVLGDEIGNVYVSGTLDKIWVRFVEGSDSAGNSNLSAPMPINVGSSNYVTAYNSGVLVQRSWDGVLEVRGSDPAWLINNNISPRITNALLPESKFVTVSQISMLLARPVGTGSTPSSLISVQPLFYFDSNHDLRHFPSARVDIANFIPDAGLHCVVCLFLRTYDNSIQITNSTPQALGVAIDKTDYDEAFQTIDDDVIPIQGFIVKNAQNALTADMVALDLRNIINVPEYTGNMTVIRKRVRIRLERQVTIMKQIEVVQNYGILEVQGELFVL
jgi:hypothetical protein